MEILEPVHCWGNVKWCSCYGEQWSLKNLNIDLPLIQQFYFCVFTPKMESRDLN